jgi:hypothetical protein
VRSLGLERIYVLQLSMSSLSSLITNLESIDGMVVASSDNALMAEGSATARLQAVFLTLVFAVIACISVFVNGLEVNLPLSQALRPSPTRCVTCF